MRSALQLWWTRAACDGFSLPSFFRDTRSKIHVCNVQDLNDFLSTLPLTTIRHTKYGKLQQKYEYRHCQCGCSFHINIRYFIDGNTCHITVGMIPDDHIDVKENLDNSDKDKDVAKIVDALIIENFFAKNYGACRIVSELCRRNIPDCKIPGRKQMTNHLYYFRKKKFGYHNEIGPLEENLRKYMFVGDEPDVQGFIYHYKMDHHEHLCLGGGSDK